MFVIPTTKVLIEAANLQEIIAIPQGNDLDIVLKHIKSLSMASVQSEGYDCILYIYTFVSQSNEEVNYAICCGAKPFGTIMVDASTITQWVDGHLWGEFELEDDPYEPFYPAELKLGDFIEYVLKEVKTSSTT